ncbi:MAG: hypothetical protein ACXVO1_08580 [Tumebacillaceae bacterium]
MGIYLSDVQEYSLIKTHELRIREVETFWQRIGCWLPRTSKVKR